MGLQGPRPFVRTGKRALRCNAFGHVARTTKSLDGGEMRIVQDRAPDSDRAIAMATDIAAAPPEGYHFWRMELQRSDRGRRTTIRVWFRRDLRAGA